MISWIMMVNGNRMTYEELLIEADSEGLLVREKPLVSSDGRIKGKRIAIRSDIPTLAKKADVLAEEMGHYHTGVGNILKQDTINARKQERTARLWSYNKRIGLTGILNSFQNHCANRYEIAEYLGVSEDTLTDALECYRQIYGRGVMVGNYFIQFEPALQVYEYFQLKQPLAF